MEMNIILTEFNDSMILARISDLSDIKKILIRTRYDFNEINVSLT